MTLPPRRPPRPEVFPPPLPGAFKEPFPKAKSDPPARAERCSRCNGAGPLTRVEWVFGHAELALCAKCKAEGEAANDSRPALSDTPPPDAHRMRSTPPSGSLLLNREVEKARAWDARDELISELRQTIVLYREKLTEQSAMPNTAPSPVPAPPVSRALVAGKASLNLGKYTLVISGALALADIVVAKWFPEYLGPLGMLKNLVGVP